VENEPANDRLYDQSGRLKFHLRNLPNARTFDRGKEDLLSNPVQYSAIEDQAPISDTPGKDATNKWFLRSDWSLEGDSHTKHLDGDLGEFMSDRFKIRRTSSFSFDLGGGSNPNGVFLHDADTGIVLMSAHRNCGFLKAHSWSSTALASAGVTGPREVYLRVVDGTRGGWGHVAVDNIVVTNVTVLSSRARKKTAPPIDAPVPVNEFGAVRAPAITPKLEHISISAVECEVHPREDNSSRIITSNDFPTGNVYHSRNVRFMDLNLTHAHSAETSVTFPYPTKNYDVSLIYHPMSGSTATHEVLINGKKIFACQAPKKSSGSLGPLTEKSTRKIRIRRGATITVKTKVTDISNGDNRGGRWELLRFSTR